MNEGSEISVIVNVYILKADSPTVLLYKHIAHAVCVV
jgi:hypothetical protein